MYHNNEWDKNVCSSADHVTKEIGCYENETAGAVFVNIIYNELIKII